MTDSTASLNVALIIDSMNVPEWQYQLVQHIVTARRIHLRLVILHPAPQPENSTRLLQLIQTKLHGYGLACLKMLDRLWHRPVFAPLRPRSLSTLCQPNIVYSLTDAQLLTHFATHNIDLLLTPNHYANLPAWLNRASRYGSCSLFFGSAMRDFDQWTGLEEYAAGADQLYSGITLSHPKFSNGNSGNALKSGSDNKRYLLFTSSSMNPAFLQQSVLTMLCKMVSILPVLLQQLRDSSEPLALLTAKDKHYRARIRALGLPKRSGEYNEFSGKQWPNGTRASAAISYSVLYQALNRSLKHKAIALYRKAIARQTWALLYGEQSGPTDLSTLKQQLPPADKFWADPQLVNYRQRHFVFFEEWVDSQQKGRIVCTEWHGGDQFSTVVPVLEAPYHLSYPHIFYYNHCYYMVPESADNKTISLYRCQRFPDRWEFMYHLMEGIEAYDATLHEHQGRWWLFANIRHHPDSSSDDLLYLYSADSPLSQHWRSHPANPIISEVALARPAGKIIRIGEDLYRPSQNCAGSYGRGLNLNRIVRWNETTYQELNTGRYIPDGAAGLHGIHTFSMLGDRVLSDGIVRKPFRNSILWPWRNRKMRSKPKK